MRAIAIPPAVREAIYAHAREAFPDECCGYLVGAAGEVDEVVRVHERARRGPDRFGIDGAELLAFARSLARRGRRGSSITRTRTAGRISPTTDRAAERAAAYPVQHLVVGVTAEAVVEAALFAWSEAAGDHVELARWAA